MPWRNKLRRYQVVGIQRRRNARVDSIISISLSRWHTAQNLNSRRTSGAVVSNFPPDQPQVLQLQRSRAQIIRDSFLELPRQSTHLLRSDRLTQPGGRELFQAHLPVAPIAPNEMERSFKCRKGEPLSLICMNYLCQSAAAVVSECHHRLAVRTDARINRCVVGVDDFVITEFNFCHPMI